MLPGPVEAAWAGNVQPIGVDGNGETVVGPAAHNPGIGTLGLGGRRVHAHSEALTFYTEALSGEQ